MGEEGSGRWGGRVRAGAAEAPARFVWVDLVSGERLLVDVHGSEEFFGELESLGFERQPDPPADGEGGPRPAPPEGAPSTLPRLERAREPLAERRPA